MAVELPQGLLVLGSKACAPCSQAAAWLDSRGVIYRKLQIDGDDELMVWLERMTAQRTIPQFFLDGEWVRGGFGAVQQMVLRGMLPRTAG